MTEPAPSPMDQGAEPAPDAVLALEARAAVRPDSPLFADFAVKAEIVASLREAGIERTFAIQELTLPIALDGRDLIGQARTGTGKTLGFGVPLLNRLVSPGVAHGTAQALVIAPTRELAVQVAADLAAAGRRLAAKIIAIYGGRAYEPQIQALAAGCDVVVGTPGRLLDLAQRGTLHLGAVRCLVLDEADEMLDLGFLPDVQRLMAMLPADRQTMLFSATMPGPVVALARQFLRRPIQIRAESGDETPAIEHVDQFAYRAHAMDKGEVLARILQAHGRGRTMIFTRTRRSAQRVADDLLGRGFAAAAVHGDLGQAAREQALRAFRSAKVDVLVATDVAARGLDVDGVTHVINYECPDDARSYAHRIGRTARAGNEGTAITLIDWDDLAKWKQICDQLRLPLGTPPETYSTSAPLHVELDIPPQATGSLPAGQRTRAGLHAEAIEDIGDTGTRTPRPAPRNRQRTATGADAEHRDSTVGSPRATRRPRRRTRSGVVVTSTDPSSAGSAGSGCAAAGSAGA